MLFQEQVRALSMIDHSEWYFWCMHEHASKADWKANQDGKEEAIKILKDKFHYTDEDIRSGIMFLKTITQKEEKVRI